MKRQEDYFAWTKKFLKIYKKINEFDAKMWKDKNYLKYIKN